MDRRVSSDIRRMLQATSPDEGTVHVVPRRGGNWAVKREGADRATCVRGRKVDAIHCAKSTPNSATVVIHRMDGRIEKTIPSDWVTGYFSDIKPRQTSRDAISGKYVKKAKPKTVSETIKGKITKATVWGLKTTKRPPRDAKPSRRK